MAAIHRIYNAEVFIDGSFVHGGIVFQERFLACGPQVTGRNTNFDKGMAAGSDMYSDEGWAAGGNTNSDKGIDTGGDTVSAGGMNTSGNRDTAENIDAGGAYLIPGLIDIHTHGASGADASDGDAEGLCALSRYYAAQGVTSFCPTTMTIAEPKLTRAMAAVRNFSRPADGAKIAGVNLEGPFLNKEKRGSQAAENLRAPDVNLFDQLNEASGGIVRLVSVAPEEPNALPFIAKVSRLCTVSIGHTTADYDTASAAFAAGASHVTHLFNAMPPLHHRSPGVIAAAYDAGASAELICDGLHVHPAVIRMAFSLFGDRSVLISDSLRCAGMPDGEYMLGGQPIIRKDGRAVLKGSETLAGSCISLADGLRNAVSFGIPLKKAVAAATYAPARAIRAEQEIGAIAPGLCADFLLLDRALNLQAVYIDGSAILPGSSL